MNLALAVYIHWPFCKSKCPYCDFNSHVREKIEAEKWLDAYIKEIDSMRSLLEDSKRIITSIFFGGGTPSLMEPFIVEKIIGHLQKKFHFDENIEITLESNPTSAESGKFQSFKNAGVNRVSIGVQALNNKDLKFLGREHDSFQAIETIEMAGKIFPRYSFDLIYARPGQSTKSWQEELTKAISLAGNHLSLYQLTIEKGTPFYSQHKNKNFVIPDENTAAELYEITEEIMSLAGMPSYEVSNYAQKGDECRHNLTYWNYGEYIGIGPGAHGRIKDGKHRKATMMIHNPETWLESVTTKGHGLQSCEYINKNEIIEEALIMGLRLTEGIKFSNFEETTGYSFKTMFSDNTLKYLKNTGLVDIDDSSIKTTKRGRLLLNSVITSLTENL